MDSLEEKHYENIKKLAIICTNSLDFWNNLNAIHEPDVNVQTKYILPVRQLLHNVYYYIN
jgi:hypothetical protein